MVDRQENERRRAPRVRVDKGIVQVLGRQGEAFKLKLHDISKQGIAFECEQGLGLPEELLDLNVIVINDQRDHDLFLTNVRGKIVAAPQPSPLTPIGEQDRSCCRLSFVGLSDRQHHIVEQFCRAEARRRPH